MRSVPRPQSPRLLSRRCNNAFWEEAEITGKPNSRFRRRADGKIETRSLDDLLAEAAQDDVVQRLPGKGRPLELSGYLHADPQTRVANKLLQDHHVIPQPLQDRRQAELLQQQAEADTVAALEDLGPRRHLLEDLRHQLWLSWPSSLSPEQIFAPAPVPAWLETPPTDPGAVPGRHTAAEELVTLTLTYNRRRATARRKIAASLEQAAEVIRRLNQQVSLSRTLAPGVQMTPVHVQAHLERFDDDCPSIAELPHDLTDRLRRAVRAASPPWWRRLLSWHTPGG